VDAEATKGPSPSPSRNGRSADWQQRETVWNAALEPREKIVLLCFLDTDRRAEGRDLYPSVERVAWQCGYSYSTTRQAVAVLERLGVLQAVGHIASAYFPRGRVTRYRFHQECLPARPAWSPDRRRHPAAVEDRQVPATGTCEGSCEGRQVPDGARQVPVDETTGADSPRDRRRITPRQVPAPGTDRTYERTKDLCLDRFSDRKITGADAPARSEQDNEGEKEQERGASLETYLGIAIDALNLAVHDRDDSPTNIARHFDALCAEQRSSLDPTVRQQAIDAALGRRDNARREFWGRKRRTHPRGM
jgi:hypothetical protein